MMKKLFVTLLCSFIAIASFSQFQAEVEIFSNSVQSLSFSEGELAFGDSIIVRNNGGEESPVYLSINSEWFGDDWDVDDNTEIRVYASWIEDGWWLAETITKSENPDGLLRNYPADSLKIEIVTLSEIDGLGFTLMGEEARVRQGDYQLIPSAEGLTFNEDADQYFLRSCPGAPLSFSVEAMALDPEADDLDFTDLELKWAMGNQVVLRDTGMTSIEYTYPSGNGFQMRVMADSSNMVPAYSKKINVQLSAHPEFTIEAPSELCENVPANISGGMDGETIIGASAQASETIFSEFFGETLFLPDGSGSFYSTTINVEGLGDELILDESNRLEYICVNVEHSYLGDLEAWITCPNGDSLALFDAFGGEGLYPGNGFGGGQMYLGDANDALGGNPEGPGIGFNYCFSDTASWGTLEDEFVNLNLVQVNTFQEGNAMAPGPYKFEENVSNLEGCPLNGEWTLNFADNLFSDNGWLFDWQLAFTLEEPGEIYEFNSEIVSAEWQEHPWITAVENGSITVLPNSDESGTLVFEVLDNDGCIFTEDLVLNPENVPADIEESGICELSAQIPWDLSDGTLNLIDAPSPEFDIMSNEEGIFIEVQEPGNYEFEFNTLNCNYSASANFEYLAPDHPDCTLGREEIINKNDLIIYPNPTYGQVSIQLEGYPSSDQTISTYNAEGKLVYQERIGKKEGAIQLDLQNLRPGIYIVILNSQSETRTGRFQKL